MANIDPRQYYKENNWQILNIAKTVVLVSLKMKQNRVAKIKNIHINILFNS